MRTIHTIPVLAAVLFAAACGGDDGPTGVGTTAKVRFFSVVWNTQDAIGFTTNDQFVTGSALTYGRSTPTCANVDAGTTTFAIGLANATGTALNSAALATLSNQVIASGGNYTVLAGGNVIHPSVVLLDNSVSGTVGTNQSAVRFVNLAANAGGSNPDPFTVLKGAAGSGTTTVAQSLPFRAMTQFSVVTSGSNAYTIMQGNETAISGNDATLNLQSGTVNTVVIVRTLSGGLQLVTVQSCP